MKKPATILCCSRFEVLLGVVEFAPKLPDLDSNQDKQYQKLSYYRYTIGQ